jgi:oxalate decarboxylase/phosphoglucose isomerase-like protein (cupin superfamily)
MHPNSLEPFQVIPAFTCPMWTAPKTTLVAMGHGIRKSLHFSSAQNEHLRIRMACSGHAWNLLLFSAHGTNIAVHVKHWCIGIASRHMQIHSKYNPFYILRWFNTGCRVVYGLRQERVSCCAMLERQKWLQITQLARILHSFLKHTSIQQLMNVCSRKLRLTCC